MCTTPNSSSQSLRTTALWSFSLCCGLMGSVALAQPAYEWPRTFTGQPDFDFNKQEVVAERQKRANEGEQISAAPATWLNLLRDSSITPYTIKTAQDEKDQTDPENVGSLQAELNAALDSSPTSSVVDPDQPITTKEDSEKSQSRKMAEFKDFLTNALEQNLPNVPASQREINVNKILKELNIQTIATSPAKYVLINNRRYHEGEVVRIPVRVPPDVKAVESLLASYLPDPAIVGNESFKAYNEIKQSVFKAFVRKRASNAKYMKDVPLEIHIKTITPQKFTANILNKKHVVQLDHL